jgi:glycosyltransferase involved in cell wall biosynthesis
VTDGIAERAAAAGIRRVHAIAWRDLDDETAGGSEIHINEILRRWSAAGLDVTLRTKRVDGRPSTVERDGVHVVRKGSSLTVWPRTPLAAMARRDGPADARLEVWHGISFFAPLWSRVPTVGIFHHVHGTQFRQVLPPGLAQAADLCERRVYPRLYRHEPLVALSASVKAQMVAELGWQPEAVHVVEPGVSTAFSPGSKADHPLVVSVGRLMPQKGFDAAIDVLVLAKRSIPRLEAVIAGDGPERTTLQARIDAAGATGWLRLAGYVDDATLLDLYRRAWALLSASRKEGWGMTITEAGACATPSVVSRIAGHVEAVADGTSGLIGDDVPELAAHLTRLLSDAPLRARLGDGARVHAAGFTWDRAAAGVFEVLANEADRRR